MRREHQAARLQAIRLRYCINTHLEDQDLTTPAAISAATGLPAAEAVRLLTRRQWRAGDVDAPQAVANRLGLEVPLEGLGLPTEKGGAVSAALVPAAAVAVSGRPTPESERELRDALSYIA
jgi:hypothetical protein